MSISKLKNARKHISLLLIVMMLFSMCSVGIPADADEIPLYYYNDSNDIEKQPKDYINGIMIAHYFNIMGAYDEQNNFKPNEPMKSSDVEYALKAIDSGEPTMSNFAGEHLTVQALVHRIWLAAGKGSYMYSAEMQRSYLYEYSLGISYDENNDFANAWTFCVKNGIVTQFFDRQDFSVNLPVTRAMAAYALSNYYLWHNEGYNLNCLVLDFPEVGQIDEEEMRKTTEATAATKSNAEEKNGVIKLVYLIGTYHANNIEYTLTLINAERKFKILLVDDNGNILEMTTDNSQSENSALQLKSVGKSCFTPHTAKKIKKAKIFIRLPDWGKILQGHSYISLNKSHKNNKYNNDNQINICFIKNDDMDNLDNNIIDYIALLSIDKGQPTSGDLNETSNLDNADCLIVQKHLNGLLSLDSTQQEIANYDREGDINLIDVYTIWTETDTTSNVHASTPNNKNTSGNTSETASVFKFMADGEEILNSITLNSNTHYLKLPENTYEKSYYSFNNWRLFRYDESGNKLYYCENMGGTDIKWMKNETSEYTTKKFADESSIYNMPTGEFDMLYFEANWINDFEYQISNGTAKITRYNGKKTDVIIPNEIDGYRVVGIEEHAFFMYTDLKKVKLPDNVKVKKQAFFMCTGLKTVSLANNVQVEEQGFFMCSSLGKIDIPDTTILQNNAFFMCAGNIDIPLIEGINTIETYSFYGNTDLETISIPESTKIIEYYAFYGCTGLKELDIPESVTRIENYAFYGCTNFTDITIPKSVIHIGKSAFFSCPNITISCYAGSYAQTFAIENKIPYILIDITYEVSYNDTAMITGYKGSDTEIFIPNEINGYPVTGIGKSAFKDCTHLACVTIPGSLRSIGVSAFEHCTSLTSMTIPASVNSIGDSAFDSCSKLTIFCNTGSYAETYAIQNSIPYALIDEFTYTLSIDSAEITGYNGNSTTPFIPNRIKEHTVTGIADWAFNSCKNLESITMPESITTIGNHAFSRCTNLASIILPKSVTSIENNAFYDCPSLTIFCNAGSYAESYAIQNSIPYTLIDGFTYTLNIDSAEITGYNGNSTTLFIPNRIKEHAVTGIADWAFNCCKKLENITIPESITNIGNHAFRNCTNLSSIIIPEAVMSIGEYTFYNCKRIAKITIPNNVIRIEVGAFESCKNLTSIILPKSVISIGSNAFYDCPNLIISCYKNSYAHTYAIENHIPYTLITEAP